MTELYNTLSIFLTGGLFLAFGLMFLFMHVPDSPLLGNYRRARHAMAGAYLFFVVAEIAKYFSGSSTGGQSIALLQTVTLTIAVSQAFLFTFAMIALLETRFPGWRTIARDAIPVVSLIAVIFGVYAFCSETCFQTVFYVFLGSYALMLVRYIWLFVLYYRRFCRRMNNYYSGNETGRMRWVTFSFCASLAIGIGALITSAFMSTGVALAFTVVFDLFYTFFAIRFIGYAARFSAIEEAMKSDLPDEEDKGAGVLHPSIVKTLETGLNKWIDAKGFLQSGIKLNDVATLIGTNSKYLSRYINQTTGMSFREWIGLLKIEEAKHLLIEHPDMGINEITAMTGFANSSHFGRQFRLATRHTPGKWRKTGGHAS